MRSVFLLGAAMALGAIASPVDKRYIVTKYNVKIATVTVYVTATGPPPGGDGNGDNVPRPTPNPEPKTSSKVVPKPTSAYTPPPPPPPPPSSSTLVPVIQPQPTPDPKPTPKPKPTSIKAPPPKPSTDYISSGHKSGYYQEDLRPGPEYREAILFHHNVIRARHDAKPLVWDVGLEERAKWNADQCNFTHVFPNDNAAGDGQNIFAVSGRVFNVTAAVQGNWYAGEFKIMTDNGLWGREVPTGDDIYHKVGHLTQIVWKKTSKVGCYSVDCRGRMKVDNTDFALDKYTVCNYAESGNFAGQFVANVGVPKSYNLGNWFD